MDNAEADIDANANASKQKTPTQTVSRLYASQNWGKMGLIKSIQNRTHSVPQNTS